MTEPLRERKEIDELTPYDPNQVIAGAIERADTPRETLGEMFTSAEIQQMRWVHNKSKQTTKRRRIDCLVREANDFFRDADSTVGVDD